MADGVWKDAQQPRARGMLMKTAVRRSARPSERREQEELFTAGAGERREPLRSCAAREGTQSRGEGRGGDPWAVSPAVSMQAQDTAIPLLRVSPRQTQRQG